jgi:UDP:flavonoid glycosyltransferase YjiC (YdhE family)
MRILLTWELGLNFGHVARLLPIAERLREQGHAVLVAVRDMQVAARVFGPRGIAFVQAPHLPQSIALGHRATGYADILLSQGWSDTSTLWGLVHGWLNLYRLVRPDALIVDYSPTAMLAARVAKIATVAVGNGFELPPLTDPLPPFPGFSWADPQKAADSERSALRSSGAVLRAYKTPPPVALCQLFADAKRYLVTWPELDHYGSRADERYIGPLLGDLPNADRVEWPEGEGPRIFACLRPDTSYVQVILGVLANFHGRIVCVAPGFAEQQLAGFRGPHIAFAARPVQLGRLLEADLCLTYGAEGTMMTFLQAGVPQLICPWHVEAYVSARRINAAGLGINLEGKQSTDSIRSEIAKSCADAAARARVIAFRDINTASRGGVRCVVDALHDSSFALRDVQSSNCQQPEVVAA